MSLLDFQSEHSEVLINSLKKNNIALSTAETGTGKTYISIYIAKLLNLKPFIVCPKTVIYNWINVSKIFNVPLLGISNYESFKNCSYNAPSEGNIIDMNKKIKCPFINKKLEILFPNDTLLIFDEAHKCKNHKTQNAKILLNIDIDMIDYKIILLSATLADKIENFKVFATLFKFISNPLLLELKGYSLIDIHKKLFPHFGGTISIKNIPNFPQNLILADKIIMENAEEIQAKYELINSIVIDKEKKIDQSNSYLEILLRTRQKIEALKIPSIIELVNDALDNGFSVVIFVNFKQTLISLSEELKIKNFIYGDQNIKERNEIIEQFQNNTINCIIATAQSGGTGISLHDIHGGHPRMSIISPSWSAQDLMQCLGRIHRAGGKSKAIQKIVFCAKTIEEKIADLIQMKFNNYAQLNNCLDVSSINIRGAGAD